MFRKLSLNSWQNRLAVHFTIFVSYVCLGFLGLAFAAPPDYATIIWPASGLALAAVIVFGNSVWLPIFLGSSFISIYLSREGLTQENYLSELTLSFLLGAGAALQAVISNAIIRKRFGNPIAFKNWSDLIVLIILYIPLFCTISASFSISAQYSYGIIADGKLLPAWAIWWGGDFLGVLFVTPILLLSPLFASTILWKGKQIYSLSAKSIIVLVVVSTMIFALWKVASNTENEKVNIEFSSRAQSIQDTIQSRMNLYKLGLLSGKAFFESSEYVSPQEWKNYTEISKVKESYPGINGIGWIKKLTPETKDDFIAWAKENVSKDFTIHPDTPPERKDIHVITYIEPFDINKKAFGLDTAFEKNRLEASFMARDTGEAALTKKIILVQDKKKTPGFLLYLPLYKDGKTPATTEMRRRHITGWIYAPFIAERFFSDNQTIPKYYHDVRLRVYDGDTIDEDGLIYDSHSLDRNNHKSLFTKITTLELEQQKWTILWESTPSFEESMRGNEATSILMGGVIFMAFLLWILYSMSYRQSTIEKQVNEKTSELNRQKGELQFLFENMPIRIWYKDDKNNILKLNRAAAESMGGDISDFEGKNTSEFFPLDAKKYHDDDLRAINSGTPIIAQVEIYRPTGGGENWMMVDKVPFVDEYTGQRTLLVAARDITKQRNAEMKLKESEERYDLVVRGMSVGLWDWDIEANKYFCSDILKKISGSLNETPSMDNFIKRIHHDDVEAFKESIHNHLECHTPHDIEFRFRHEDGHYIWVRGSGQATWDSETGKPLRMVGSLENITARKFAEEALVRSEELNNLAVRGMSVGLWDWNILSGEITTSYKMHEILGQHTGINFVGNFDEYIQAMHPDDIENVTIAINNHLAHRKPYDIEFRLQISIDENKREYIWVRACGQAKWDEDGKPTRMVGSIENINGRKSMEENLIRSNTELERFAYVASHDLQEPLRMVRNFTQLLDEECSDTLNDDGKTYMKFIIDGAGRMQDLVSDLLEYSRADKQEIEYEDVDVNMTMHNVEQNLLQALKESQGKVIYQNLPVVHYDSVRLSSLLQNLVGNGIKYRRMDVAPVIEVQSKDVGDYWQFSVSDNGIGIKEEYLDQVFVLFKRLHRSTEYQGTGIGLSICKKIVENMGGEIWIESVYGQGSTFYFTIPKHINGNK